MNAVAEAAPSGSTTGPNQYLTFLLGEEEYGVEILTVQEVKAFTALTPLPTVPPHVRGVMNLRGTIIPVIDLRKLFGTGTTECTPLTVTVVVTIGTKVVGLLADAVSDVVSIAADDIREPPDCGEDGGHRTITGIAHRGERLLFFLDLGRVLGHSEPRGN